MTDNDSHAANHAVRDRPVPPPTVRHASPTMLWIGALLFAGILTTVNIIHGNLNQDEGWYLMAALRTAQGQMPYRDFLYTQGPVMPVAYGILSPLWAPRGLLGGRVLTAAFGLLASGLAAWLAARWTPPPTRRHAALTAWMLTACVPVHSYFTVIPKTYALSALLLLGGWAVLSDGGGILPAMASGILLALAAATRLSLGVALPVVFLALWVARHQPGGRGRWGAFGVASGLTLALTLGLCLWRYGEPFRFALQYHGARESGGLAAWMALRAGFSSRSLQTYPLLWILVAGCLWWRPRAFFRPGRPMAGAALGTALAATLVHALSPFPYDDYQTPVMPLLAAFAASTLWRFLRSETAARDPTSTTRETTLAGHALPLLGLCTLILGASSPLLMDWVVIRQDRFWFERKSQPDLVVLRETGRWIRDRVPPGQPILTQDTYLAVEAGRDVPPGLEMGPFSLFPHMKDSDARKVHVHTPATLRRLIADTDAPIAATSGYSFALACPGTDPLPESERNALFDVLREYYKPVRHLPNFGQAHTTLTLWGRHPEVPHAP